MLDRLFAGDDSLDGLAGFEIDNIEANGFAEADIRITILSVDGEGKHPGFTHIFDLRDNLLVARVEHREHRFCAEKNVAAVEGDDAVVGLRANGDTVKKVSVLGIDDEEAAVFALVPPASRNEDFFAVGADARTIAAGVVSLFPKDFVRFQINAAEATAGGGVICAMIDRARRETAQAFLETRNRNSPHEFVLRIDVENQNPFSRT